jgi:hypothetical protein
MKTPNFAELNNQIKKKNPFALTRVRSRARMKLLTPGARKIFYFLYKTR